MARFETHVGASPARVWAVLADGHAYSRWVPGTQRIRRVEGPWPQPGSVLHYSAGAGPLSHDGHTEALECEEGRRLVMEAHAWPLGTALIAIELSGDGTGTRVRIDEHPERGPGGRLHNPLTDGLLWLRGQLMLRRLRGLVGRG
ncbi:MAG: SRPBCC domain-containing protein [Frankiaceae bacterium]